MQKLKSRLPSVVPFALLALLPGALGAAEFANIIVLLNDDQGSGDLGVAAPDDRPFDGVDLRLALRSKTLSRPDPLFLAASLPGSRLARWQQGHEPPVGPARWPLENALQ